MPHLYEAALPQHIAVSLRLTVAISIFFLEAAPPDPEA
jgi:hypothetical protein